MNNPQNTGVGSGSSSGELREDIRRTRAEMDQTVDRLAERLRPRHLIDEMIEVVRGKITGAPNAGTPSGGESAMDEAKQYGSALLGHLKNHPMPAALIGAGVTWLLFDQARDGGARGGGSGGSGGSSTGRRVPGRWRDEDLREYGGSFVDARTGEPYDASYGAGYGRGAASTGAGASGSDEPGILDKAKDAVAGAGEKLADAADAAKGAIAGAAGSVKDSVAGAAGAAREAMGGAAASADDARRRAAEWSGSAYAASRSGMARGYERSRRGFEDALNEYPLAMGAAALAAGVLAGLLLPGTQAEDRLMGEQADRLKDQARDAGQDLLERGKEVASTTADEVAGEVERQGVAPGSLIDKVKHVVHDAADAVRESAHREGLDDLGGKATSIAQRGRDVATGEVERQKDDLNV